ncbi:MAG: SOS response-associated peptidase [Halofilum sp. (in: g-proteobacteria)]|nr:SOS response-associated peptidase [Halofilum sp. (in: g-proteobacteria)]
MCGRYTLRKPRAHPWLEHAPELEGIEPAFNIAPGRRVPVVGRNADGDRVVSLASWGFHPRWLPADARSPINARAETAGSKPMFRGAFRKGRCLVPADGWYEWQERDNGPKQPYFFHRPDDALFWFAGLAAMNEAGERTLAILTTDANEISKAVHPRMPVVLGDDERAAIWLDPGADDQTLQGLLMPAEDGLVETYPVSRRVNRPANDEPACVEREQESAP